MMRPSEALQLLRDLDAAAADVVTAAAAWEAEWNKPAAERERAKAHDLRAAVKRWRDVRARCDAERVEVVP